jgi:hypothetical protein
MSGSDSYPYQAYSTAYVVTKKLCIMLCIYDSLQIRLRFYNTAVITNLCLEQGL